MLSMLLCLVYTHTALPNDICIHFSFIMALDWSKHVRDKIVCNDKITTHKCILLDMSNAQ
jgi:hypothetical protein